MSETLMGSGEAFVVNSKCNKVVPFTSSFKWTWSCSSEFYKINYNISFIGSI